MSTRRARHASEGGTSAISRREATRRIGLGLGGAWLAACGAGGEAAPPGSGDGDGGAREGDATDGSSGGDGAASTPARGGWARGGTKSMEGGYPDPFPTASASCVLTAAATEGPCTEAEDRQRRDVSEGFSGLPVRLALRIVDASCEPVAGARVKIWHTQVSGSYTGTTPNDRMCLTDATASAHHAFRGVQTTDERGRVDFDTCFPGWYRGRAVHIHFTVTAAGRSFTSQLLFEEGLVRDVFSNHAEYKSFGLPDTTNEGDLLARAGDLAAHTLATSRMGDGAMMAAKELVVPVG